MGTRNCGDCLRSRVGRDNDFAVKEIEEIDLSGYTISWRGEQYLECFFVSMVDAGCGTLGRTHLVSGFNGPKNHSTVSQIKDADICQRLKVLSWTQGIV
jgi:hypothetical protein